MNFGFECLFFDDFSDIPAGQLPSQTNWNIDTGTSYPGGPGDWGTGEVEVYTRNQSNIAITKNETLRITPIRLANGMWTSSRIETTSDWDFSCEPGRLLRVEARIKLGNDSASEQQGIWPAFWLLGSQYRGNYHNWPAVGEIDIMESVNGEAKALRAVHCGTPSGGPCQQPIGLSDTVEFDRGMWHVFTWEVDRRPKERENQSMKWYLDDGEIWTLKLKDVDHDIEAWDTLVGSKKMILLNVAVGGALPNAMAHGYTPTKETKGGSGAEMEVDYVAVLEKESQ